jgi:hypothetical protein
MSTDRYDAALPLRDSTVVGDQSRSSRRWWHVITSLIAFAVLTEAVFAGAMFTGIGWARTAHAVNAGLLLASAFIGGLVALFTLRRVPHGLKLGWLLLSLAGMVVVQAALGALSAKGANLLWAHVPLGVALFGLATRAVLVLPLGRRARRVCAIRSDTSG